MTLDEFFVALQTTPRDWRPYRGRAIRRPGKFMIQCPITAIAGFGERKGFWTYGDPTYWRNAATELGLRKKDAAKIVSASDGHGRLRPRLLAACGLGRPDDVEPWPRELRRERFL